MSVIGAKEAAEVIRPHLTLSHLAPEDQHAMLYLKDVASHLGLDHTPDILSHIASLLRSHGLDIHVGHEYPKMVKRAWDGKDFEAQDAEDEERIINEPPPPPPPPPPAPREHVEHVVHEHGEHTGDPVNKPVDHFAEQEPGAAAMRPEGLFDDGVTLEDDKPTHDQPAAEPKPRKRPV